MAAIDIVEVCCQQTADMAGCRDMQLVCSIHSCSTLITVTLYTYMHMHILGNILQQYILMTDTEKQTERESATIYSTKTGR